jgi:hypothetical protein
MEVYLTSKFYKEVAEILERINPALKPYHRTRKKFLDVVVPLTLSDIEVEKFKDELKDYFSSKGIDVSFRV